MKILSVRVFLVALLLSTANIHCGTSASLLKAGSPLLSSLASNPNLSTITNLLKTPGLDKLLGGVLKKPFTLLAPTNDAFSSLGADAMSKLTNPSNVSQLANLLKDQIVPGKLDAGSIMQSGLKAASGKALDLGGATLGNLMSNEKFNILPISKLLGG